MGIDAVIAAGDGVAARKIFQRNKALLEVGGKPIIRRIVETLRSCSLIDKVVVVGPAQDFAAALEGLDVRLVEQKRNMAENALAGFLATLPGGEDGQPSPEVIECYQDKAVLGLSGDIPLLTVAELEQFIARCDMDSCDFASGYTAESVLKRFGPRPGRPGIKMATMHTRHLNVRQNNLHVFRGFKMLKSIDLILKIYEYRYQKDPINVLKSLVTIVRQGPTALGQILGSYSLLQFSALCDNLGLHSLERLASYPVTLEKLERLGSELLGVRWRLIETDLGGAALDVDNEKDFLTLNFMFREWSALLGQAG
ncbi:MAG: molybdopterin-guanine dinucleotide biosynthesis protein MobA [Deltaproteobacteria bacterium ADurb.Bin510]|nr:MAG: molybdopterin-guanine dinucleotide biosynthesis protein MobA [Deltaproteobacteria bacterium ADurb.Bin510]